MSTKNQKTFQVQVTVEVITQLEIKAESFEDALAKAKTYDVRDVVEFDTDYVDGSIEIDGVWK